MFKSNNFSGRVKQHIEALPFAELAQACKEADGNHKAIVDAWAETHGLRHKAWVYPQILAHLGRWTLSRNTSNLFSAQQLLRDNAGKDEFNQGIYYLCVSDTRYLAKQSSPEGLPYCALVPLFLAAHKKMSGIAYKDWDRDEVAALLSPELARSAFATPPVYTVEELLQFRTIGLTTKSGKTEGKVKSTLSTYGLNGLPWVLADERVGPGQLPQLLRMMLCQTWCAHPQNRNKYMILDPLDWDRLPEPLVDGDPLPDPKPTLSKLPW